MKFVIAPDSFKGSLTAQEVAEAIKNGLQRIYPTADYELVPMADGGEGTVQSLVAATNGRIIQKNVHNPLNQVSTANYGLLGNNHTAVIEMAQASGIQYVDNDTRNPLVTTTYGTGELILDAINHGVDQIILGIGGSATNDGGMGMAQALGVRFIDHSGSELTPGGGALGNLAHIDVNGIKPQVKQVKILIASDVSNPLTGKTGASAVFGPQKGATLEMVQQLDANLHHYAEVVKRDLGKDMEMVPGVGATGGLGYGLLTFTNAQMEKGIDIVISYTHLKERTQGADYVFTGEGRIDFQTKFGKTPYGVALATKKVVPQAPVIVLTGNVGDNIDTLYGAEAMDAIFSTPSGAKSLHQAIQDSRHDIALTAENIARLISSIRS